MASQATPTATPQVRRTLSTQAAATPSTAATSAASRTPATTATAPYSALRTPVGGLRSSTAGSASSHTPLSAAIVQRAPDQLDRIRLDARLGGLLANPLNHPDEASSIFAGDVASIQETNTIDIQTALRALEFKIDRDDWMFGSS